MFLHQLTLIDYRSYQQVNFSLEPGVTVLVGLNGHGKTNAMEAIGYLATMSSHRVSHDAALVRKGADFAIIRGVFYGTPSEKNDDDVMGQRLEVQIMPGRVNRAKHQGISRRPRDLIGIARTVLFAPEDLHLVRGDPEQRRRFLDDLLVGIAPRFAGVKADYERVVKQRNALLKSLIMRENRRIIGSDRRKQLHVDEAVASVTHLSVTDPEDYTNPAGSEIPTRGNLSTLSVWDQQLVTLGSELTRARLHLVARLQPHFARAYLEVSEDNPGLTDVSPAELNYEPRTPLPVIEPTAENPTGLPSISQIQTVLYQGLENVRRQEIERGVSLIGPHRDDLELRLLDFPVKGYASHGETWSIVLALKLAAFALLQQETASWEAGDPILILDDVFAELDTGRRRRLAHLVKDTQQVLITAAVDDDLPTGLDGAKFGIRRLHGISSVISEEENSR